MTGAEATVLTKIALIFGAASTVLSIKQQRKATKASKRSLAAQQRIADIKAARARTKAVREARIRRAEVLTGAQATGAGDTSAATGAVGSVQSQLGANLSFLDRVGAASKESSIFQQQAVTARGRAETASAIGDVGFTVAGSERLQSIFKQGS